MKPFYRWFIQVTEDAQLPDTSTPSGSPRSQLEAQLQHLSAALAVREGELQTAREEVERLQQVSEGFLSPYEVQKREEAALRREAELLQTLNSVEEELTKVGPNDSKEKEVKSIHWAGTGFY